MRGIHSRNYNSFRKVISVACLVLILPVSALAQTVLEEVVVTASKRGASTVQDLSMSISAFGEDTLDAMGAVEFTDFSRSVAGLDVVDVGPGQKRYMVRGLNLPGESTVGLLYDNITMSGTGAQAGEFGRNQSDLDLFDVERVEVLRGPQGTQYGANSVSGVVRFITNKPDPEAFDGKVVVGGAAKEDGDADYNVKGMVNIPLSDNLAVRAIGYYSEIGGFIDNMQLNKDPSCYGVTGVPADGPEIILMPGAGCNDGVSEAKDINSHERVGGRINLQWTPSEDTRILLQGYYQSIDSDGRNATHPLGAATAAGPPVRGGSNVYSTPAVGERESVVKSHEPYSEDLWIAALEIEHDFDWANATISASRMDRSGTTRLDSSNPARLHRTFATIGLGPFSPGGFGPPPPAGPFMGATISPTDRVRLWQDFSTEVTNFEARLASQFEGRFNFLAGVYYQDNVRSVDSEGRIGDPSTGLDLTQAEIMAALAADPMFGADFTANVAAAPWQTDPFTITARNAVNTTEILALYGEVYIDVTDQFELMGGLRYFDTSRNQVSEILTPFLNSTFIQGAPAGPDPRTDSSESDVLFKGQAVYRPTEDHQIYAQVAQGYRAGGVNSQTVSQIPAEYDSDQTLNLEAGVKTSWLDGRLLANLSVYTIDWDNIQFQMPYTQQFNGLVNCTEVSDAVTAEGFEIDLQAQATDNLDIGFNFTSMDAKWNVDANDCLSQAEIEGTTFDDDGDGLGDGTGILAGDSMIGVPDHSGSAYAQYNFGNVPFGADSAFLRADIMFQGTVPTNDDDPAINLANPSYELVNINGGIDFGRYSLSVFVRNVFDKKAHLSLFQGFQQDNRVTPSNPRTIGASFTYNFSD